MRKPVMLNEYVLLEMIDENQVSSTGVMQVTSKGERTEGWALPARVLAVGQKNGGFKVGDQVYVSKWEIHFMTIDGKKCASAKHKDIILVLKEEPHVS